MDVRRRRLPLQLPTAQLQAPPDIVGQVTAALAKAAREAQQFDRTHSAAERWLMPAYALQRLGWPPSGDQQAAEIAVLKRIATMRTPEQNKTAEWYSEHGLTEAWDIYFDQYAKRVGPRQAAAGRKLLHDTLDMVHEITQTAKAASGRKRPYDVDPSLTTAVKRPGGSPSYPSGHTSAAFAAATVLSYLMPERRNEFMNIAMQASYARIYGGVHFPSDVVSGAKLGTSIAWYMAILNSRASRAAA